MVKGYDAATRAYATTYDQIDVGCEGCHGPGSTHVKRAENGTVKRGQSAAEMGLQLSLAARGQWQRTASENIAHRVTPLNDQTQVDNCGRCHSRRATLGDYHYGQPLLDTHRLSVIESPLYWHDGQIRDEVYVYGSFVQSKMARPGSCAATVTTLTAMHWLPRVTQSAHSATSRKRMMPRRIIATSPQVRAAPALPATCRHKSIWGSMLDAITACEFLDRACHSVPAAPTRAPSATKTEPTPGPMTPFSNGVSARTFRN